jgi:hypothetical protein
MRRPLALVVTTFVLGILAAPLFEGSANAEKTPVQSALDYLKLAKQDLERDKGADTGGHRARAIQLTNEAIEAATKVSQPAAGSAVCAGCLTKATNITVVSSQSATYSTGDIQASINARKAELLKCFSAGWDPNKETTKDYLIDYDAAAGTIGSIRGPMFGTGMNANVLSCMNTAIKGAPIRKTKPVSGVIGCSITLQIAK